MEDSEREKVGFDHNLVRRGTHSLGVGQSTWKSAVGVTSLTAKALGGDRLKHLTHLGSVKTLGGRLNHLTHLGGHFSLHSLGVGHYWKVQNVDL